MDLDITSPLTGRKIIAGWRLNGDLIWFRSGKQLVRCDRNNSLRAKLPSAMGNMLDYILSSNKNMFYYDELSFYLMNENKLWFSRERLHKLITDLHLILSEYGFENYLIRSIKDEVYFLNPSLIKIPVYDEEYNKFFDVTWPSGSKD
ncbi:MULTISPECIES: hypothetical protein [Enterobacter]|uniref:hypothetical protein n=1 Tax=Enterobacter TaxID=547 RepID=UPI0028EBB539|nr:hypothetical protein [Enterobacter cloacae]WNT37813.1 hypothetical protein RRL13_06805 [Enterobacter cloacae]HDR2795468.1 hypothetical protein [Enterobacter asburiae]HDR2800849.1 hypothetical protein [Enterobacter asburiae]